MKFMKNYFRQSETKSKFGLSKLTTKNHHIRWVRHAWKSSFDNIHVCSWFACCILARLRERISHLWMMRSPLLLALKPWSFMVKNYLSWIPTALGEIMAKCLPNKKSIRRRFAPNFDLCQIQCSKTRTVGCSPLLNPTTTRASKRLH